MSGKSKKKRAKRAARAQMAAQEAEQGRIRGEAEVALRGSGEEIAATRRARQRGGLGLLSAARVNMNQTQNETLG